MGKRAGLSKKTRFEVFKRDSFKCRYCGKGTAQDVVLHVDHVIPVAAGGDNSELNLVTACFDCNMGKSDRHLNDLAPVGELEKTAQLQEYKEQVRAYFKFIKAKTGVQSKKIDLILKPLGEPRPDNRASVQYFLKHIEFEELLEYSNMTASKLAHVSQYSRFKYLCGICHNVIKQKKLESLESKNV